MEIVNGIYSPFLDEQKVEYSLATKNNKNIAVEVTGPNGAPTVRPPENWKPLYYTKEGERVPPKSDS
jgi:hypothetical protein